MPVNAEQLRDELRDIGDRRLDLSVSTQKLAEDTLRGVRRARGILSMVEVATLVGLDRTSLYQTYLP